MKLNNTPLTALTCAALLGSAALSQAAVIVSENFTYADGALNGQSGGTGFSNAWTSTTNVVGGVATGNAGSTRSFTATPFASSGTLWVSFDWGYASAPTESGSYGGLTFYNGGSEKQLIGNTWPGTGHDKWGTNGATISLVSSVGVKTGVAKITLGAGATSMIEVWVGATGSPVDVSGPALLTATGRELAGVDGIRILGQDFGGDPGQSIDNLVIGTTMGDVPAIPEPSTALLGALGMLALLRRKR